MNPEPADKISSPYDVEKLEAQPQPQEPQLGSKYDNSLGIFLVSSDGFKGLRCLPSIW